MLNLKTTLPRQLSPKGASVTVGVRGIRFYVNYEKSGEVQYFIFDSRLLFAIVVLLAALLFYASGNANTPSQVTHVYHYIPAQGLASASEDVSRLPEPSSQPRVYQASNAVTSTQDEELTETTNVIANDVRTQFIQAKQKLIYEFTTKHNVVRTAQLSNEQLLLLNREISELFQEIVIDNLDLEPHVYQFFTDTTDLHKLNTALVEQDKYHVPASITLSQAALETSYGRKVKDNNYFGIKDKAKKTGKTTTTEYYTPEELEANAYKVIQKKKVIVKGKTMYKCTIIDHFKAYQSPWESFRAHSVYLSSNPRYAPLFTGGKSYEAWADKIGSMKQGGVGYATDPVYGRLLKKIVRRYHLDLLDH